MVFRGIDTADISVVMQGAIDHEITVRCLASIRSNFPGAEIILSTWEGSDTYGLDYDVSVFSKDPGASYCDDVAGILNNTNRQLVSTMAGIRLATRRFILKTRTDIIFLSADFLNYFGKYDDAPSRPFGNRLLICNYYTRSPRVLPLCFHPSDWIVFGRSEDILTYYRDVPLMSSETMNWFRTHEKTSNTFTNYICRFTPEQHIFLSFLCRYEQVNLCCYYDWSLHLMEQSERLISECFVVLDYGKQLKIEFVKYAPNRYLEKHTLISHRRWKGLYEHYCLGKNSFKWCSSLVQIYAFHLLTNLRTGLVRFLSRIGLKEQIKELLRAVRKWYAL